MKIAQLCILALLIVAGAIPLTSAQSIQTGQAAIYCPGTHSGNCPAADMIGTLPPYSIPAQTGPNPSSSATAVVNVFVAFSATGGPTQKNIMITIKISSTFTGLPMALFVVGANVGSNAQVNLAACPGQNPPGCLLFATNPLVPLQMTFALLSVSRLWVNLGSLCSSSGCTSTEALVPPGQFYTIEWQIQDPPGSASTSLPFDLLTIIALVTVPIIAAQSVYLVSLRRRLSKKA